MRMPLLVVPAWGAVARWAMTMEKAFQYFLVAGFVMGHANSLALAAKWFGAGPIATGFTLLLGLPLGLFVFAMAAGWVKVWP